MDTFFIYLFNQFVFRVSAFIRHWYFGSFKVYSHQVISLLERLDQTFALKINWRHLFEPLFQDKTFIGYIFGFLFRSFMLIFGGIFYALIILLAFILYLLWAAIPLFILFKIMGGNIQSLKWI